MLPSDVAVAFELTPADYVAATIGHYESASWVQGPIRRAQIALVLLCALGALMSWASGGVFILPWLIAGAIMTPLLPGIVRKAQRREIERLASRGIANGFFGPHQVRLTEDGLVDSTPSYERLTRWSAIEGVKEEDRVLMVYVGPDAFIPIPASAFLDRETLEAFRDRFLAQLDHARRLEAVGEN